MTTPYSPRFGQDAYDYNALLNTQVQATAVPINTLNATVNPNPSFETDTTGWGGYNGTFTRANDRAIVGSWSGKFVPNGTSNSCGYTCDIQPATAGLYYGISGWINCATARQVNLKIDWRNGVGFVGSGYTVSTPVLANTWTYFEGISLAPATTDGFNLALIIEDVGNIPAADVFWGDDLRIWTVTTEAQATALLAPRGENWRIDRTAVKASTNTLEATAYMYRGLIGDPYLLANTFAGSSGDENNTPIFLRDGEAMYVQWIGGDLDATYTVTLNGWRTTPYGGFRSATV